MYKTETEKTILCFGDSNTWGYVTGSIDLDTLLAKRFAFNKRWPGVLQQELAEPYRIIEAGLNGRTTNIDDPEWPDRNGLSALPILLESNSPIDMIIVMLGTNDMKSRFNRTASDIISGMSEIIDKIRSLKFISGESETKILVISPPIVTKEDGFGEDFKNANKKSSEYAQQLKHLCKQKSCYHLDASELKFSEIDGVHLEERSHQLLGQKIARAVKEINHELKPTPSQRFSYNQ
ncbi:MAG: SGNH/GDSL hydrolase family protein [Gammaproteobacteria bacterium]|nr:SGNH/GDSL hydrolase family protein [Gammaproteobacteria bacterium]